MFGIAEAHIDVVFIDHSEAFYNGITDFGSAETKVVDCYAHMYRKVREGSRCSSKKHLEVILADIAVLSTAPSINAFHTALDLALHHWKVVLNEPSFVDKVPPQYVTADGVFYFNRNTHSEYPVTITSSDAADAIPPLDWQACKNALSLHAVSTDLNTCKNTVDLKKMAQELPATKKVGRKRKHNALVAVRTIPWVQ
jgi:hypothetical protein